MLREGKYVTGALFATKIFEKMYSLVGEGTNDEESSKLFTS